MIALMLHFPNDSVITPNLGLHLSATLVMLLTIKRFDGDITKTLGWYWVKPQWLFLAVFIGMAFWLFDHWLLYYQFSSDSYEDIKNWQLANAEYHFLGLLIGSVFMAPIFEELFFRGLIFRGLVHKYHFIIAALTSALLFALIHWSWPEFISLFTVGVIYALMAYKSHSIFPSLIAHVTHNLLTYIYYTS